MDGASVYILRCSDESLYVGVTQRSVEERVSEHNSGLIAGYTCHRRPVELLFSEAYARVDEAIAAEKRIKGWSRAKKIAYMRGVSARFRISRGGRGRVRPSTRLLRSRLRMMNMVGPHRFRSHPLLHAEPAASRPSRSTHHHRMSDIDDCCGATLPARRLPPTPRSQ